MSRRVPSAFGHFAIFVLPLLAAATLAVLCAAPGSARANTCAAELQRAQQMVNAVTDPGKRQAVQALLQHAQSEHLQGDEDRCMSDVTKAEEAMSK